MQKRNWIELGGLLIEKHFTNNVSFQLKRLPLQDFKIAVAPFSGPIAILHNERNQIKYTLPKNYDQSIIIFNCKGQSKKIIPFKIVQRILSFQFMSDQSLFIAYATGTYFRIDPYSGNYTEGSFIRDIQRERCTAILIYSDYVFALKQKQLGMLRSLEQPLWEPFISIKMNLQNPLFCCESLNSKAILLVYLSRDNTIQAYNTVTCYKKTIFAQQYLKQHWQDLLAISTKENNLFLVIDKPAKLYYVQNYGQNNARQIWIQEPLVELFNTKLIHQSKSRYNYQSMYQIGWVNNVAVFSNRKLLVMFTMNDTRLNFINHKVKFQIDGIRIIAEQTHIYRIVDLFYQRLVSFGTILQNPENDVNLLNMSNLQILYSNYVEGKVIKMDQLEQYSGSIQSILNSICQSACLCLDMLEQSRIFKFIAFLMNYYRCKPINLQQVCTQLRIINNLKYEYMNRVLTLQQFRSLKENYKDTLLTIFLRYNMHFIADSVLGDSYSKQRILLHWAKCKIQKESQTIAIQLIKDKFLCLEGKISHSTKIFTQLSKYCIERDKLELGLNLIEFQQNSARKVMVSLLLLATKKDRNFVDKVMRYAQESRHSWLLYRVIKELLRTPWLQNYFWVNLLHGKPNLQQHYLKYLRQNNHNQLLKNYFMMNKMYTQFSYEALSNEINQLSKKGKNIETIIEKVNNEYSKILPNLVMALKKTKQTSIKKIRQLKLKKQPISTTDIIGLTKDQDLECLFQIIVEKDGNWELAVNLLSKLKGDKVYKILMRKGRFTQAIEIAFSRKNRKQLQQLQEKCPQHLEQLCMQRINQLSQSKN